MASKRGVGSVVLLVAVAAGACTGQINGASLSCGASLAAATAGASGVFKEGRG